MTEHPVVVGVDGSAASLAAVDLAVREAAARRRPLRIVHAFSWPYLQVPLAAAAFGRSPAGLREHAERIVAQAAARARALMPEVPVSCEVVNGAAAPVLLGQAAGATQLVVGDRGHGAFAGLLLGSVAVQVTAHAPCPVLVARGDADPTRPVLVGVDGAPGNQAAIGYAFEEAALRGVSLTALYAWTLPTPNGPSEVLLDLLDHTAAEAAAIRSLAGALEGWPDKYPEVTVQRALRYRLPRQALIDATVRAQLVVVGTRGTGGFTGLLLGSVTHAVIHHAHCPVAVVPSRERVPTVTGGGRRAPDIRRGAAGAG